jgi:hypothetical protein
MASHDIIRDLNCYFDFSCQRCCCAGLQNAYNKCVCQRFYELKFIRHICKMMFLKSA